MLNIILDIVINNVVNIVFKWINYCVYVNVFIIFVDLVRLMFVIFGLVWFFVMSCWGYFLLK